MKKLKLQFVFCFLISLILSGTGFSANELFRSNASGNWNTLSTWQMSTNNGATWIAATAPPRDTSGLITIRNPNAVAVTGVVTASSVTIDSGANLNGGSTSGSGTLIYGSIINNGTLTTGSTGGYIRIKGPSLINNGAFQSNGTIYFDTTTSLSGTGSYTPANTRFIGNVTLGNSITYSPSTLIAVENNAFLNLNGNTFTFTSGSIYLVGTGEISANGTVRTQNSVGIYTDPLAMFNASLNVNAGTTIANDDASPLTGRLYGNVTIDAGATLNGGHTSGRSLWIYGNIINNGTLTATSSGGSLRIKGSSLVNNGVVNSAGNFYFDTTTSVSGNGAFTSTNQYLTPNAKVTLMSNITISPPTGLTLQTGAVLNLNNFILTYNSGTFVSESGTIVNSPGTVRTQNDIGFYPVNGSSFNADLKVNTGTTFTGNSGAGDRYYGNITIDNSATMNCGATSGRVTNIHGNIINNGTLTATSTNGHLRMKGPTLVNSGSINAWNLYFDSTTSVSGSGSFTSTNQYITPNGNVTLMSNVTTTPSAGLTLQTGAVLNLNNYILTYNSGTFVSQSGTFVNSPGTVRTQNDIGFYPVNGSSFNAELKVNTGTTFTGNSGAGDRFYGNITIDNNATMNCGATSGRVTNIHGYIANNGTLTASSINGHIRIKGPSLVNNGLVALASGNFYFDTTTSLSGTGSFTSHANLTGNANVTLNSAHQMLSVTINAGTVFNISNQLLKVAASNPIAQNGTFNTTNSKIEYNGTALQSVSVTNISYYGLRISNPAGATLLGDITVNDTLSVILGKLNLNARIITLPVTGYLTETPGNVIFGVSGYITTTRNVGTPAALNVGGLGAVLTATTNLGSTEVRRGHTVQTGLNGGTSIKRYYDITPANNTGLNATLVYKFDDSELNGKPEPSLKLFKSTNSGSTWLYQGGTVNIASSQITLAGITSFSRWSADSSKVSAAIGLIMEGFYNIATNNLNMTDTVRAYLRNISAPYAVVDSAVGLLDSLTFKSGLQFSNAATGTYYIQLKHRNSLETWSKFGINYIQDSTLNYDFTFAATQAYGNNEILKGTKYCLYSGDVTQDGFIDLADVVLINNASSAFTTGYVSTDVNGNSIVDLTDIIIASNNANNFISKKTP